ncbi:CorA metal ion transporter [Rhizina undulata]
MTHPSSPHDKAGSKESQDSRSLSPTSIPPTFTGRQSPLPSSQPPSHSQPPSFHAGTPGTAGTRHSRSTPWRTRPHRRRSIPAHVAQGTPTPFTPVNMSDSYNNHLQPPSTSPGATGRRVFFMNRNRSDTSIESSALLDHREQQSMRPRRASMLGGGASSFVSRAGHHRALSGNAPAMSPGIPSTSRNLRARDRSSRSGDSDSEEYLESAPLISGAAHERSSLLPGKGRASRPSTSDSGSLRRNQPQAPVARDYGSVNFPPSVPSSPRMDPRRPLLGLSHTSGGHYDGEDLDISGGGIRGVIPVEMVINIEDDLGASGYPDSSLTTPPEEFNRQNILRAEEDVCFPVDDGFPDEEVATLHGRKMRRRRRVRQWPDLSVLEEWSRDEKEERSEGIRTKKMSEPVYVGGRLRSGVRTAWHREEDEAPYRFTYFNDELPATIHSHTISELLQPGQTFKDLFKPEPRVQEDSSSEGSGSESEDLSMESEDDDRKMESSKNNLNGGGGINGPWAQSPIGRRPTFWLDVFSPTDAEMKVLSKAFGIHPLTTEDIMMQETREKVELCRSYFLVSRLFASG